MNNKVERCREYVDLTKSLAPRKEEVQSERDCKESSRIAEGAKNNNEEQNQERGSIENARRTKDEESGGTCRTTEAEERSAEQGKEDSQAMQELEEQLRASFDAWLKGDGGETSFKQRLKDHLQDDGPVSSKENTSRSHLGDSQGKI